MTHALDDIYWTDDPYPGVWVRDITHDAEREIAEFRGEPDPDEPRWAALENERAHETEVWLATRDTSRVRRKAPVRKSRHASRVKEPYSRLTPDA